MKVNFYELKRNFESKSQTIFLKNQNLWFIFSNFKSRYFGGFIYNAGVPYRFLDEINFNEDVKEIDILSHYEAIFSFSGNEAYLKINQESIEINFSNFQEIKITFDIKEIFKNDPWKREINIEKISSNSFLVKEYFENKFLKILISADSPLKEKREWVQKEMDFDKKRNSPPEKRWVFDGIEGKVREIKIKILDLKEIEAQNIVKNPENSLINFLLSRINSLILDSYLPAGFPWFYENWFRDELLTLYLIKDFLNEDFFRQRIKFYLNNIDYIWNKNKFSTDNHWNWPAVDTFPLIIINLPEEEFLSHFNILEKYLSFWQREFIKENKIFIPPFSSWMDTLKNEFSLEVLALYLKALKRFSKINSFYNLQVEYWEKEIKNYSNFSDINFAFLYLFLEDIFSKKEWENIFDNLIKENYLDWGGFSSISKNDPNFKDEDDGEIASAYHQGDSWYFINNLLAFSLKKLNYKKYQNIVNKILKASLEDLFLDGALGWSSEISSAKERRSEGSLIQLWSMASLIYLLRTFQNIDIILESL